MAAVEVVPDATSNFSTYSTFLNHCIKYICGLLCDSNKQFVNLNC